jgi:two-component system, OmpR family, sensor histidine kinase VicK
MYIVQDEQLGGDLYGMASRSEFDVLDRSPDPALDELTGLAAALCGADFAYICFVDANRLWFKSRHGFQATDQPRAHSGCHWTIESGAPLLVEDAAHDPRFSPQGIELAGARCCRSYAGVSVTGANQEVVGTLAVLAERPGQFSEEHLRLLDILGRQVATRLDLYYRIGAQEQAQRARQRTERALAIERGFVGVTLDSIPALVVLLDTSGHIARLNNPAMQLTGLSLVDAIGRPFFEEYLEGVDESWIENILSEAVGGLVSGPHETLWRAQQGSKSRRISWTLRPLPGPNDEIQYLIVTGQDVTDHREVEKQLLTSENRYRQVVENSLGFLFACTIQGRLTSLNAYTAETLGYRHKDLIGHSVTLFLESPGDAIFQAGLQNLTEAGQEWQGVLRVRRSDGVYRHIALRSRRMELPDNQPFVLNHGMDVTEQHEAEEALFIATRQRELILESVGDGIYGMDLDGRFTFVNKTAAHMLGYTPGQMVGRDVHGLIHHSNADGSPSAKATNLIYQSMCRREQIRMRDEVFWRKDGTALPIEYSASPLIENGQVSGMVVAFQDVSERRRLERMKDEFISTVSHELRTPLTSLRASLGLIASGSLEKRPEKLRQMVEMAIGNCDRLVQLVNGILDFNRMEKGQLPFNRQPVEALSLLRRAAQSSQAAATKARINFRIDAPAVTVMADEKRILQVLNELISNAIKFSPPETLIRLVAHPSGPAEICFHVQDQGRGIPLEKLDRIFDRFQQGDASDTRDMGGTGLGLALCRSIVEQHGGQISAQSQPGKGCRILFTLPTSTKMVNFPVKARGFFGARRLKKAEQSH